MLELCLTLMLIVTVLPFVRRALFSCKAIITAAERHTLELIGSDTHIHMCNHHKVSLINRCGGHLCDFRTLLAFLSWWKWSAMAPMDKYTRSVSVDSYNIYIDLYRTFETARLLFYMSIK